MGVDDSAADSAEHNVVDELTDDIVEGELDGIISRSVDGEFSIVIIVETETLGITNTVVTQGVVEEEDVDAETIGVVEAVEAAGEGRIVTIVEAISIRGDDGTLDVVESEKSLVTEI